MLIRMKKFLPYLFLVLILGGMFLAPAHSAEASSSSCIPVPGFWSTVDCFGEVGNIVLWGMSRFLWVGANLFDYTLDLTLNSATFSKIDAIYAGWKISRDLINIFFIFILLYIAIATILRLTGYGAKELLVKVVIIALLVNFSLVITKVVIDASNILAMEFYSNMGIKDSSGKPDITSAMMQGLSLATIYDGKNLADPQSGGVSITGWTVLAGTFGGSILILVTSFVFFAATILFVIRTVFLLFLMILSPFAFVAMILPGTKKYASQWWSSLFSQAFFAPAFMFMIYLVLRIINDDTFHAAIGGSLGADATATISGALTGNDSGALGVIVKFIILIGLMIGSLIVASKMGAVGSSTVMKWGNTARMWGQGYAGGLPGRLARRATGGLAENIATGKSGISRTLNKIPGVAYGAASITASNRAKIAEIQKKYEKFTDKELKEMTPRVMPFNRAAILNELAKRGNLKVEDKNKDKKDIDTNFTQKRIEQGKKVMDKYGMSTKEIDKARPDLIEKPEDRVKVIKSIKPADLEKMDDTVVNKIFENVEGNYMRETALKNWSASHLESIKKEIRDKIFEDDKNIELMIKNFSAVDAKKLADMGGVPADAFFGKIAALSSTGDIDEIATNLIKEGNKSLAAWVKSGPAVKSIIEEYGKIAQKAVQQNVKTELVGDEIDRKVSEYEG